MSTYGSIVIEGPDGAKAALNTEFDGQRKGGHPFTLGKWLPAALQRVLVDDWPSTAWSMADALLYDSLKNRKGEELHIDDPLKPYGDYFYIVRIEAKRFKSMEYTVVTAYAIVYDDDDEVHEVKIFEQEEE